MKLQQKFKTLESEQSALLATNFYNYETVNAVLQAAAAAGMPIILQASPSTINYLGVDMTASLAKAAIRKHNVEAWLHLDHAESVDLIRDCLDAGFDSVMIDASENRLSRI